MESKRRKNAIKELEVRINKVKSISNQLLCLHEDENLISQIDYIDTLLYDIQDFIDDLKEDDDE